MLSHDSAHHPRAQEQALARAASTKSDSLILPMPSDWTIYVQAALRQQDPAKLPKLVEQARRAINDRWLERGTKGPDTREREELEDALRQLTLHEMKRTRQPQPPEPS